MSYTDKKTLWMQKYPAISDLQKKAMKRMPKIAREYLEAGTDGEELIQRNLKAFEKIRMKPKFLQGELSVNLETELFGKKYAAPFGMAPIGISGLMWPRAEILLAQAAVRQNIPFSLSTVAAETPQTVGPHVGNNGWFQLYTPKEKDLCLKFLKQASTSGFHTLLLTVDIPMPSRRQRTRRAGLGPPVRKTPEFIWELLSHPAWFAATLRRGFPKLRMVEDIVNLKDLKEVGNFVRDFVGGKLTWEYATWIKEHWDGPVVLKGIMQEEEAQLAIDHGFDGIVVSNHGGRQFDAAPSSLEVLPGIVKLVNGQIKVLFDSGIRSGLDVIRALALGADFTFLGRPFIYSVAALGALGPDHAVHILKEEMENNMMQLGIETVDEIKRVEYFKS